MKQIENTIVSYKGKQQNNEDFLKNDFHHPITSEENSSHHPTMKVVEYLQKKAISQLISLLFDS